MELRDEAARRLIDRLRREALLRSVSSGGLEQERAVFATGLAALDEALGGGLPRGCIVEVVGPISSGRTAFLLAVMASATGRGEHAALVDPFDAFDAEAAVEAGVVLDRVLWVRPRGMREALRAADLILEAGGFGVVALEMGSCERAPRSGRVGRPATASRLFVPWPRLALRAERSRSILLTFAHRRDAGTFAAVALGFSRAVGRWIGGGGAPSLLDRMDICIEILKVRGRGACMGRPPLRWAGRRDAA